MAGHVFLGQGDLRRLACDAWLMPCDAEARPQDKWLLPGMAPRDWPQPPLGWQEGRVRALQVAAWPRGPQPWLVNVEGDSETPARWYVEGVQQFLDQAGRWLEERGGWLERARPLLALPLVGTGAGGGRERAGQIVAALLKLLQETVRGKDCDIVLVAHDGPSFAAAQAVRLRSCADPWHELDDALKEQSRELAGQAARGELALFLGAGISASAGLPLWDELLDRLAEKAGMPGPEREALDRLNPLDQAAIIETRLGGAQGLHRALRELFTSQYHALGHALLAALPVDEVVTTNYDQLFEGAWEALGCEASVLPYLLRPGAPRWVLKMHGCVSHPEDIVLTRRDQIGYGERHAALAGVVQTLLITRHMLFVGFSLNDDNFHRIADAARRVVHAPGCTEGRKPFGTALVLERNRLMEELWKNDLEWVGMRPPGGEEREEDRQRRKLEAARRLEVFLDYLLAQASRSQAAHLLDDRYEAVLTSGEREMRKALLEFVVGLSEEARHSFPWAQVERLLIGLGLREGTMPRGRVKERKGRADNQ